MKTNPITRYLHAKKNLQTKARRRYCSSNCTNATTDGVNITCGVDGKTRKHMWRCNVDFDKVLEGVADV